MLGRDAIVSGLAFGRWRTGQTRDDAERPRPEAPACNRPDDAVMIPRTAKENIPIEFERPRSSMVGLHTDAQDGHASLVLPHARRARGRGLRASPCEPTAALTAALHTLRRGLQL